MRCEYTEAINILCYLWEVDQQYIITFHVDDDNKVFVGGSLKALSQGNTSWVSVPSRCVQDTHGMLNTVESRLITFLKRCLRQPGLMDAL